MKEDIQGGRRIKTSKMSRIRKFIREVKQQNLWTNIFIFIVGPGLLIIGTWTFFSTDIPTAQANAFAQFEVLGINVTIDDFGDYSSQRISLGTLQFLRVVEERDLTTIFFDVKNYRFFFPTDDLVFTYYTDDDKLDGAHMRLSTSKALLIVTAIGGVIVTGSIVRDIFTDEQEVPDEQEVTDDPEVMDEQEGS